MAGAASEQTMADPAASSAAFAKRARKIALLVGDDDFTAAHCAILISVASELAREVVVIGPAAVCQDIEGGTFITEEEFNQPGS